MVSGYTIATIVVSGVLMVFVIPTLSYALLQGFSYILTPLSTCGSVLGDFGGGCRTEVRVFETSQGRVVVNVTRLPEVSLAPRIANIGTDLLLALLALLARVDVMVAAFAIDLITMAYESAD